jgi:hypothetical protein
MCKCPTGIWIIISPLITQRVKTILHRPLVTSPLIIFDLNIAPGESLAKAYVQFVHCTYMYCILGHPGEFWTTKHATFCRREGWGATLILIGI